MLLPRPGRYGSQHPLSASLLTPLSSLYGRCTTPLEAAGFVSQLNSSNPAGTDPVSQADDHLRLIKAAILATFPNFTPAALNSTQAQIDAATAAVVGTGSPILLPAGTASLPGLAFASETNTGLHRPAAGQVSVAVEGNDVAVFASDLSVAFAGAVSTNGALSVGGNLTQTNGAGQLVPTGVYFPYAGSTAPPGYLLCNGAAVSRTTFAALFAVIGSTYGAGDGSTTFNVPNLAEVVPMGVSGMGGIASRGLVTAANSNVIAGLFGEQTHVLSPAEMPVHTHAATLVDPGHHHQVTVQECVSGTGVGGSPATSITSSTQTLTTTTNTTGISLQDGSGNSNVTASAGSGTAHNNLQPTIATNYIIKV